MQNILNELSIESIYEANGHTYAVSKSGSLFEIRGVVFTRINFKAEVSGGVEIVDRLTPVAGTALGPIDPESAVAAANTQDISDVPETVSPTDIRSDVCNIISDMLDNPGPCEIYPTSIAYDRLIRLVSRERYNALVWMHAELCSRIDNGVYHRNTDVQVLISKAEQELKPLNL